MFDSSGGNDKQYTWFYYGEDCHDTVTLHAETADEIEIIERIPFLQHNKDQLWILLPKKCVYMEPKEIQRTQDEIDRQTGERIKELLKK